MQTLDLHKGSALTPQEKQEMELFIEKAIEEHKGNRAEINKLTMDSVTALTVTEARANELANQGFLKKMWGGITGKNQKIRADIDRNIAKSQYASQQMIQKLAEQNLLTFDLVTAVNNKLNTLALELDQEINQIYNTLLSFFKQTRSDIIQMEARIEKLERNVDLLHWNTTIEYQMYNEVEYAELPDTEKIVCLSNDFFHRTKGEWSTADLMLLKSTLAEIGLPIKSSFSTQSFFARLIEKPALIDRLFEGISLDGLKEMESYEAPLIKGVEKLTKINGEERYLYQTLANHLEALDVPYEKRNLQLSMIHQYLLDTAYMKSDAEVNLFDFVVELLVNLQLIHSSVPDESIEDISTQDESEEGTGDYDVFLISPGDSKLEVIKAVKEIIGSTLEEAKQLVDKSPINILSMLTLEKAEVAADILQQAGASVRVKTYIENYQIVRSNISGRIYLSDKLDEVQKAVLELATHLKVFVDLGDKVTQNTTLARVYYGVFTDNKASKRDITSNVIGELISLLFIHGQEVKVDEPIMLIKIDE